MFMRTRRKNGRPRRRFHSEWLGANTERLEGRALVAAFFRPNTFSLAGFAVSQAGEDIDNNGAPDSPDETGLAADSYATWYRYISATRSLTFTESGQFTHTIVTPAAGGTSYLNSVEFHSAHQHVATVQSVAPVGVWNGVGKTIVQTDTQFQTSSPLNWNLKRANGPPQTTTVNVNVNVVYTRPTDNRYIATPTLAFQSTFVNVAVNNGVGFQVVDAASGTVLISNPTFLQTGGSAGWAGSFTVQTPTNVGASYNSGLFSTVRHNASWPNGNFANTTAFAWDVSFTDPSGA